MALYGAITVLFCCEVSGVHEALTWSSRKHLELRRAQATDLGTQQQTTTAQFQFRILEKATQPAPLGARLIIG
jgi:hypothetical protein